MQAQLQLGQNATSKQIAVIQSQLTKQLYFSDFHRQAALRQGP